MKRIILFITHFALSDEKGNVLLKEVPVGNAEHTDREACSMLNTMYGCKNR